MGTTTFSCADNSNRLDKCYVSFLSGRKRRLECASARVDGHTLLQQFLGLTKVQDKIYDNLGTQQNPWKREVLVGSVVLQRLSENRDEFLRGLFCIELEAVGISIL
jgi:hypothetical protein